jgi:ketosteroid isomerase-like protein
MVTRILILLTIAFNLCISLAEGQQRNRYASIANAAGKEDSQLTGLYRIDLERSDKLYSVVASASSNLPFEEQQRFFIDLAVRLTPPDLLVIEQKGKRVAIASSRAPRMTLEADGSNRIERTSSGNRVQTRAALSGSELIVTVSGKIDDRFSVSFNLLDNGRSLKVTRHIHAKELNQPIVIQSFYNRISDEVQWGIQEDDRRTTSSKESIYASTNRTPLSTSLGQKEADLLRALLNEWIAATNNRDIEKQMTFYVPTLNAYYLGRNYSRSAVRAEKDRVFKRASVIDIRAGEPEIIFQNGGQLAIMRFRKQYAIEGGGQNRRGEVVQELHWKKVGDGWKIISERDVKVIR